MYYKELEKNFANINLTLNKIFKVFICDVLHAESN